MSKNASSEEVKAAKKNAVGGKDKFKDVDTFAETFSKKVSNTGSGKFSTLVSPRAGSRRI